MKKILLVSGDSFSDKNFQTFIHPELDTSWPKWPELLAKKLDMECVNIDASGAGNDYIYEALLDTIQNIDKDRIGLVIAAWSQCQRRSWQESKQLVWKNCRVDVKGDVFYWVKRTMRYWYSFQVLCERYNLPYKQFQMVDLFKGYLWQELISRRTNDVADNKQVPIINNVADLTKEEKHWKETQEKKYLAQIHNSPYYEIINSNFIGWPTDPRLNGYSIGEKVLDNTTDRISKIDLHPNKQGQEKIAEFLYDRLG